MPDCHKSKDREAEIQERLQCSPISGLVLGYIRISSLAGFEAGRKFMKLPGIVYYEQRKNLYEESTSIVTTTVFLTKAKG